MGKKGKRRGKKGSRGKKREAEGKEGKRGKEREKEGKGGKKSKMDFSDFHYSSMISADENAYCSTLKVNFKKKESTMTLQEMY